MKTKLFITGLAFVALTAIASAQTTSPATNNNTGSAGRGAAYVDANNDGVCDNFENTGGMHRGYCAGQGKGMGKGNGQGKGMAAGQNRRTQKGAMTTGRNFVDTDKNGICDNREKPAVK